MNKINKDIRDKYHFYLELLQIEKRVDIKPIILEQKTNNARWLSGECTVSHYNIQEEITLKVERSTRDSKYGIKLRCKKLSLSPFVRFDSDGPAHRNDSPEIPLEEQSVTTPHFNTYAESGKPIAYKTPSLDIESESQAIVDDINLGISHFCIETNINNKEGRFPESTDKLTKLDFDINKDVDLKNIKFD